MRVKICGITKSDQGCAIAQMGATALGFICVPASPRYISSAQIREITNALQSKKIDRIGVFVNASDDQICETVTVGCLTGIQLHGDESLDVCQKLRRLLPHIEIIKALRVRSSEALDQAEMYAGCVDTLLLDAYHPQMQGGTGQTLDWKSLQEFNPSCPWLLAGGLTPENISDALNQVKPAGIDLSSGVERSPGDKDLTKVARLFERLGA